MAQFTVYENINKNTKDAVPYLVDVQNEILSDLNTRVVIPMCAANAYGNKTMKNLSPVLDVNGSPHILLTPQLAGISVDELGRSVCNLSDHRSEFINALDFLFTGF